MGYFNAMLALSRHLEGLSEEPQLQNDEREREANEEIFEDSNETTDEETDEEVDEEETSSTQPKEHNSLLHPDRKVGETAEEKRERKRFVKEQKATVRKEKKMIVNERKALLKKNRKK